MNTSAPRLSLKVLSKARRGDEQAFAALYDAWAQPIYNFIFRRVKTSDIAQDLTADVFLKVWKYLPDLEISNWAKFRAWLYRIARNVVIDHYRAANSDIPLDDIAEAPDETFGMETSLELSSRQHMIEQSLKTLSPEFQRVIELRYFDELPINKVAQIMRKKEGAVRTLTHRALQALKQVMGES